MTRRTLTPRVGESGRRASRMAPGGRLYSESPVTSFLPSSGSASGGDAALLRQVVAERTAPSDEVAPGPYPTLGAVPEQH